MTLFLPVIEGIDWESDDVEDAATKIQVKTILIRSAYTTAQRLDFLGGKLDAPWQNWKGTRNMKTEMKKTKRRMRKSWVRMRAMRRGKIEEKHDGVAFIWKSV